MLAKKPVASVASTSTSSRTSTVLPSTVAVAPAETLFVASMPPTPLPFAPYIAAASEIAALERVALIWAALVASTASAPAAAVTVDPVTSAVACDGCSPPNASSASSGSPRIASIVLNRMFCDSQPTELNARVMPTASSPE